MALFIDLVLRGAISLRGTSKALSLVANHAAFGLAMPSANTGRNWLLRLGLYELQRPKEQADDWVWIVDHTIQISNVKCFLVLGCRLSRWQQSRGPLSHQDVEVLMLEPVPQSSGEIVHEQLSRCRAITGEPRAIVSDGGGDLTKGVRLFREQHPRTAPLYDITHKLALFLKKLLTGDERWGKFLEQMASCKKKFARGPLAFLTPPLVRDQARYMNLEALLCWATVVLEFMDNPRHNDGRLVEPWVVRLEFEWLRKFEDPLRQWRLLLEMIEVTLTYVRHQGYHQNAELELRAQLATHNQTPETAVLLDQLLNFVADQSSHASAGERLLGSSEVIESLIGKGKQLEGQQSRSGFTEMILGLAASVVHVSHEKLMAALASVKTSDVLAWARKAFGITVQSKRRRLYQQVRPRPRQGVTVTPQPTDAQDAELARNETRIIPTPAPL